MSSDTPQAATEEKQKLHLEVQIEKPQACRRHVVVTIPQEDIQRYVDQVLDELVPRAEVPGFRPGRAPRKLVAARFRKEIAQQVKAQLLLDAIDQVTEEHDLVPISEPDFDPEAVELPQEGNLTFEFDLEVRPEFELPQWKGLKLRRPVRQITDEEIQRLLQRMFISPNDLVPVQEPAQPGDFITADITFYDEEERLSRAEEELLRLRPVLSFRDGVLEGFDELMKGVRSGEERQGRVKISAEAPNPKYRNKELRAVFHVLDVRRPQMPELTPELLTRRFGPQVQSEEELRRMLRENLQARLEYQQREALRNQITELLLKDAQWELPPELLRRQAQRELQRTVLELRRSGFTEAEIRAYENRLRQNALAETARALKQHFILERIAEEEGIDATPEDYDREVLLIAAQSGESPRRIRARLEKTGGMDVLRNQIVERKVIDLILQHAEFEDVPLEEDILPEEKEFPVLFTITAPPGAETTEESSEQS